LFQADLKGNVTGQSVFRQMLHVLWRNAGLVNDLKAILVVFDSPGSPFIPMDAGEMGNGPILTPPMGRMVYNRPYLVQQPEIAEASDEDSIGRDQAANVLFGGKPLAPWTEEIAEYASASTGARDQTETIPSAF
jgi:hypothetical protein